MDGNTLTPDMWAKWAVQPPSNEFLELPAETRETIRGFQSRPPVKLGELAKRLGIRVVLANLPPVLSAWIGPVDEEFVIRVNRHVRKINRRLTLAHELAHFLLHRDEIVADGGWSENVLLRSGRDMEFEYEANRLAFDLVVPPALLSAATADHSGPMTRGVTKALAKTFEISAAAIEMQLGV